MEKKERNSAIEILRIIAMLLIICSHYMLHGAGTLRYSELSFNKIVWNIFVLGNLGVDLYVLISGYFLCKAKFDIKKMIRLYLQVIFYSVVFFIIFSIVYPNNFSIISFIKSIFPISFVSYWFITGYIALYFISPFLNKFINYISKKEYTILLLILIIICSLHFTFTSQKLFSNEFLQLILMYLIGGYVRLYLKNDYYDKNKKNIVKLLAIFLIIYIMIPIVFNILGIWKNIFALHTLHFYARESIFSIILSVLIFIFFINKRKYSNIINKISKCTLGVYLIHENFLFSPILWTKILKVQNFVNSSYFIVHFLCSVLIVYILCTIIEYLRIVLIEVKLEYFISKISIKLEQNFKKISRQFLD